MDDSTKGGLTRFLETFYAQNALAGYIEYIRGCSVHQRDIMIHVGDIMSTLEVLSISEGYHDSCGGMS